MAVIFSLPEYVPDPFSGEVVTGYQVQSSSVVGSPALVLPSGSFSDIAGSPFVSNLNIVDPSGTVQTFYRIRPLRQITVGMSTYTLDSPWSKPIQYNTPLYDAIFTRALLPTMRFTYLGDQGVSQTNGTVLQETTGAGQGQWVFDGTTTRFNLQYVMNDDPIRVLDDAYRLIVTPHSGSPTLMQPNVDYAVDTRAGVLEFATAPASNTYARFEYLRTDFVNCDLLQTITTAVNALSQYGINGYQVVTSNNLQKLNRPLLYPDLVEIIAKVGIVRLREGLTEAAMRGTTAWRDGNSSVDPYPSRALEFLVQKTDLNDAHIRKEINTFIRGTTSPIGRGEYDVFFDCTQLTPLTSGMFVAIPGLYGAVGAGIGQGLVPFYT